MKTDRSRPYLLVLIPLCSLLILLCVFWRSLRDVTGEGVLQVLPQNALLAVLALWGLYAVKSCSVFFPLCALQIAAGLRWPLPVALAVNAVGLCISLAIPFWLGRASLPTLQQQILARFPRLQKMTAYSEGSQMVYCFLIRIICLLPGDLVSWYQGTGPLHFSNFLLGTALGKLTGMLMYTLLGDRLREGLTWHFALVYVALVAANYLLVKFCEHQARRRGLSA